MYNSERSLSEEEEAVQNKIRQDEIVSIEKQIAKLAKKNTNATDPLIPIFELILKIIISKNSDALKSALSELLALSKKFIQEIPKSEEKWIPEEDLSKKYIEHLDFHFNRLMENYNNESYDSTTVDILDFQMELVSYLISKKMFEECKMVILFWEKIGDRSIGKSSIIFQKIINIRTFTAKNLLDVNSQDSSGKAQNLLENVLAKSAWLTDRLLTKIPLEETPLINNYEYSTDYDASMNAIYELGSKIRGEYPEYYPLVYFDYVEVVFEKLLTIYQTSPQINLKDNIWSLMFEYQSFAEQAIPNGNRRGAELSVLRIMSAYELLHKKEINELRDEPIKMLVDIGILAAGFKEKLLNQDSINLTNKNLDEWVIDILATTGRTRVIEDEIMEEFIKMDGGDSENRWAYITELGNRLNNNFGLMFDPETQERYSSDDPRRK